MPVLKPAIPPFYRGITSEFMAARLEAEGESPVSQFTREQAPQRAQTGPISPTASSEQATPKPAFQPKTDLLESRLLSPPVARVTNQPEKAEMIGPRETQRTLKPEMKVAGREINVSADTINARILQGRKIDLGIPSFESSRTKRSGPREPKETGESRTAVSARTSAERHAAPASFMQVAHAKEPVETTITAALQTKSSVIPSMEPSSVELLRPSRKSQRSEKSTQELQPRKNAMEKEALAVATQLESRGTQGTAATRGRQESQARTAGGVHIGSLEVRIMPPAPPAPIIKPQQARPAPATVLSRSFTSSLGLTQG